MDQAAKSLLAKTGAGQKKKAKGAPTSAGRRPGKYKGYYLLVWPGRKLRRILRRNGVAAARAWAEVHGALMLFEKLKAQKGLNG